MTGLDVGRLRAGIPALHTCTYLNTGTSGPLPARVTARIRELLLAESVEGPASPQAVEAGIAEMVGAKRALARLLNVATDELAITQNATQGLTLVAGGYPWQPGDEVLTTDQEHVSGLVPWYGLARHRGVKVRVLPVSPDPDATVATFAGAITPATRLIAISHVSWCTGMRLPVERLCELARERGVLTAVDGAQAVGQIPVDLRALGCDFYTLPGQKWLLGPDGTGAFFVRREALEKLPPPALGWASVADYDLAGGYTLFPSARRYETATVSVPMVGGFRTAVEMALEHGATRVATRIASLAAALRSLVATVPGVRLLSPEGSDATGLVCLALPGVDPDWAAGWLWREERVLCRSIPTPRCLRFSVHAFNTEAELHRAVEGVARAIRAGT